MFDMMTSKSNMLLLLNITADAFGVKTDFVSVDFNDCAAAYDKIRPHLEKKDIGILGESHIGG